MNNIKLFSVIFILGTTVFGATPSKVIRAKATDKFSLSCRVIGDIQGSSVYATPTKLQGEASGFGDLTITTEGRDPQPIVLTIMQTFDPLNLGDRINRKLSSSFEKCIIHYTEKKSGEVLSARGRTPGQIQKTIVGLNCSADGHLVEGMNPRIVITKTNNFNEFELVRLLDNKIQYSASLICGTFEN